MQSRNKTSYFHKKPFLVIENRRKALIHHYKYVDTLGFEQVGNILKDSEKKSIGKYKSILRKIKLLKYFNNQNLIHIPIFIFSNIKSYSQSLQRIDCIEFKNQNTVKRLKNIKKSLSVNIFPSELKYNTKLQEVILSLGLFPSRAKYFSEYGSNVFLEQLENKLIIPSSSNLKYLTVEAEKIFMLELFNPKEFQKLKQEFDDPIIFVTSRQKPDKIKKLAERLTHDIVGAHEINMYLPPLSLQVVQNAINQNTKSWEQLKVFLFYESEEDQNPNQMPLDATEYQTIPNFSYLNHFGCLETLALRFDCRPYGKNISEIINSILPPSSLVTLSLQLINCDIGFAVEEFALSSKISNNDSVVAACFEKFFENFLGLKNLESLAFEVEHLSTDSNILLDFSLQMIRRLFSKLSKLYLSFDQCRLSSESLKLDELFNEISKFSLQALYIGFPYESSTSISDQKLLATVICKTSKYFFSNFSKETLDQVVRINGNKWFFGTNYGNSFLSFPHYDLLKPGPEIERILELFRQSCNLKIRSNNLWPLLYNLADSNSNPNHDLSLMKLSKKQSSDPECKEQFIMLNALVESHDKLMDFDLILPITKEKDNK